MIPLDEVPTLLAIAEYANAYRDEPTVAWALHGLDSERREFVEERIEWIRGRSAA